MKEPETEAENGDQGRVRSSPLVRKIAKEHNVDLAKVPGTGLGGRITKEDIEAFIAKYAGGAPAAAPAPAPAATAAVPEPSYEVPAVPAVIAPLQPVGGITPGELVPMTTMRKKIAEHMIMSKRTSAHVHGVFELDVTRIVKLRDKMKAKFEQATGSKLTFTPFLRALRCTDYASSPLSTRRSKATTSVTTPPSTSASRSPLTGGLIVPVVKNAEERSFVGLQRAISDLGERARTKKLKPDEVQVARSPLPTPESSAPSSVCRSSINRRSPLWASAESSEAGRRHR